MTNTLPPYPMSATSAIRFRDPFVSSTSRINDQRSWPSPARRHDFNRALTPPPEMNGVSQPPKSEYHRQPYSSHYGEPLPNPPTHRAPILPYLPQETSNAEFGRNGLAGLSNRSSLSPGTRSRSHEDYARQQQQQQHSKAAQANAIAPSFQIPRSVNDSGGSLSELAAQITCLFWFESWDILQQVEDSKFPVQTLRQLVPDAKPTTGFMKWVTTILSTTLVAQNVVLLALLFIHRLKKLNPTVRGKPGSEYRLLTVALMLGNKFLDDNTYTNKTWAEVSGINVNEVHIMEVEFLSNMKYCLFTSSEQWSRWQSLLGKFADFFERASRPQPRNPPAPILPPASSLHLPMALPSPPSSNQASPPYVHDGSIYPAMSQHGPTPAPSPLTLAPNGGPSLPRPRKRSHDDTASEPPAKRIASGLQSYQSPRHYASTPLKAQAQHMPRLPLPSLAIPNGQASSAGHSQPITPQGHQLPPLQFPGRAMAMVYPNTSSAPQTRPLPTGIAPSQPPSQTHSQQQYRQQSPHPGSAMASPTVTHPMSATSLYPPTQVSPTYFLQQRNSPYRPIHNVSTLLYPPPSGALQPQPQSIEYDQMRYQPLGKSIQQRQSGRLPYVAQNVWLEGNNQHKMTPVSQWPGFNQAPQQRSILRQ